MKSTNKVRESVTKALALPLAASVEIPGAPAGVRFTETALIVEKEVTSKDWNDLGRKIAVAHKASKWWLGDWLISGPNLSKFDESMDQAGNARKKHRRAPRGFCQQVANLAGVSPDHVSNIGSICRRVRPEHRHGITPGHAIEILNCVPDSDFPKWRDRVIKEGLSCKQLRILLRQSLRTAKPSPRTSRPPMAAAEFLQCVRTFNAERDKWTDVEWEYYEMTFAPIIKAFAERSHRRA